MNESNLRKQQQQAESRRFLQALSAGQVHVYDRFGNPIAVGGKLVYQTPENPLCDVVGITPVLDPQMPAGLLDVTMTTTIKVRVRGNMPLQGAIVVGPPPQATTPPAATDPPSEETSPEEPDPPTDVMESPTDHAGQIKLVDR